jgi:2-polyprenyl-6-methoxyphenol hydroxylase-like FAD-dependent oxidoreductase
MCALKIAIVGGGIGGLVLALALRERRIGFELYALRARLSRCRPATATPPFCGSCSPSFLAVA